MAVSLLPSNFHFIASIDTCIHVYKVQRSCTIRYIYFWSCHFDFIFYLYILNKLSVDAQ